jgi:hypothetical protein
MLFDAIRTCRVIAEEEAAYRSDDSEGDGLDATICPVDAD